MRILLFLLVSLSGCGGCDTKPLPVSPPPPEPVAAPKRTPLSSKPLRALDPAFAEAQPRFSFAPHRTYPGVVFVELGRSPEVSAGILIVRGKSYAFVPVDGEDLINHGWMQGHASHDRRHLWAIMDSVVESPGWELSVLHSADGGASWTRAEPLRKPYYLAGMHELRMRSDGSGELVVLHEDTPVGPVSDVPPGYYIYSTKDWGDSWSAQPVYVPDILVSPGFTAKAPFADLPPLSVYLEDFSKHEGATP